jgi:type I restriction enzyme S subunit
MRTQFQSTPFPLRAIEELLKIKYGKGLAAKHRDPNGTHPVYGSNGIIGFHAESITKSPTIVIGRKGSVGEVNFSSAPCWPIDTAFYIDEYPKDIDPKWLFYCLSNLQLGIHAQGPKPGIKRDLLYNVSIPVPEDINEQRRLVARIEELTRRADEARMLRRESSNSCAYIRPSYIRKVVDLCNMNVWEKAHLGDKRVAKLIMGQSPLGDTYNWHQDGLPLLNGPTEFGEFHPLPIQWTTDSKRHCVKGDILFCVRGSTTGRVNWADQTYSIGRGIAAIRANAENILPEFLYSMVEIKVAEILHNAEGGVFPNFNKDQLCALTVPLPPIKQQEKIVEEMVLLKRKNDELAHLQQSLIQELDSFRAALLAKAFRGEL